MVASYIIAAAIGGIFGMLGSVLTSYVDFKRTELEQESQNNRVQAEFIAEREAEAIQELGRQLEENHRLYQTAVRRASVNALSWEEFEEDIDRSYESLFSALEKSIVFLSEDGEIALREYIHDLIGANQYLYWKSKTGGPYRDGDPERILSKEETPEHIDFNFQRFCRTHQLAKEGLRKDVEIRIGPLKKD